MAKQDSEKPEQAAIEFLKSARDITFIFGVFLYFTGWIYIYAYLDKFGLTVKAVDIDIYNTLIYASNVFIYVFESPYIFISIIIVSLASSIFWNRINSWLFRFLPIIIIMMFPLTFLLARSAASAAADKILENPDVLLKKVLFTFKTEGDAKSEEAIKKDSVLQAIEFVKTNLFKQSSEGNLRLLVSNKDEYYVLMKSEYYNSAHPAIYVIKKDLVNLVFIK